MSWILFHTHTHTLVPLSLPGSLSPSLSLSLQIEFPRRSQRWLQELNRRILLSVGGCILHDGAVVVHHHEGQLASEQWTRDRIGKSMGPVEAARLVAFFCLFEIKDSI